MNPKRVVIVGGSGFIGSAIANRLCKEGVKVLIPTRRRSRAGHVLLLPNVEVVEGNVHDVDHAPSPGASPDAFGYRVCGVFRDIMAYPCQDEHGIPYFSSADTNLTYGGQPIGVAGSADAARSMRSTAAIVAGFRNPPAVISAPLAPTDFLADEESSDGVSLSWTDAAGNETGYRLERSMDGYSWMEIAALPANTQNFIDTGLPGGKTVSYRIHAWNSLGASPYLTLDKTRDTALPTANPGRRAKALSDR